MKQRAILVRLTSNLRLQPLHHRCVAWYKSPEHGAASTHDDHHHHQHQFQNQHRYDSHYKHGDGAEITSGSGGHAQADAHQRHHQQLQERGQHRVGVGGESESGGYCSVFRPQHNDHDEHQRHLLAFRHYQASVQIFSSTFAASNANETSANPNESQVSCAAMHEVLDKAIKEHNLNWACDVLREMCARDYNEIEERMYFALLNEVREQSKHSKIWARVNKILRNSIDIPPRVDFIVDVFHRQSTRNEFAPQIFD